MIIQMGIVVVRGCQLSMPNGGRVDGESIIDSLNEYFRLAEYAIAFLQKMLQAQLFTVPPEVVRYYFFLGSNLSMELYRVGFK